jgi:hypothetical protein
LYWLASSDAAQNLKLAGYNSAGTLRLKWDQFTPLNSFTSGQVNDMAVDSNGALNFVGSFPSGYARIKWATSSAITTFSEISTAISTNATNVAVSSAGLVAFGGSLAMGPVRVFSTATAVGAETTTFGNLSSSSTVTSALTTALAHGSSDIAFDSTGRLLVGGQTFGLKRIKTDGTLDSNFVTTIPSATKVNTISFQGAPVGDAGKIVVGLSASPWIQRLTP